jgi:molybdenum cofactor synthesis domain-containing protein
VISVDDALSMVLANAPGLPAEEVTLAEALGRVLAADVASDVPLPRFDRSAMDGYALRAEDLATLPTVLDVVGQVRAGEVPRGVVGPGQAVQIMTGAPVPAGATAVQPVERTRSLEGGRRVEIVSRVERGAHISPCGSEVREGDIVLVQGTVVTPAAIAVLAAVGGARVCVARRPRVKILVTGDELVEVTERPRGAQIRNSNGYALMAQARCAGAQVETLGVASDDLERIAAGVERGLDGDVLLVSGGVSEGAYDFVEPALERLGVELLFTKVAIKPGAPLVFGRRGGALVFGLPGNPVSAQVTFDLFVRAALLAMQGADTVSRPRVEVEIAARLTNRSGRRAHSPARVLWEAGRLLAHPLRSMGSADVVAYARANALLVMEADHPQAEAGQRLPAILLADVLCS